VKRAGGDVVVIDVGNTKTAATLMRDGTVVARWRVETGARFTARTAAAWDRAVAEIRAQGGARLAALVASVVPSRTAGITGTLRRHGLRCPHLVTWRDPWPFELALSSPQTVGVDRLAHVAGMVARGWSDGVSVGIGTAVIVDVLREGRFIGGCIFPGVDLAARALRAGTAQLPRVAVVPTAPWWGSDTRTALESGVLHGTVLAAAGMARRIARRLGTGTPIVVTGRLGDAVAAELRGRVEVDGDLLARGIGSLGSRLATGRKTIQI
jgi:type III pantothenate kinase